MTPNKFSNTKKREKNGGDNEILGIILVIISAFMLLCIVIQPILGSISRAIAHVVLGLFGLVSYPIFLCTLILGIALIQDRKIAIGLRYISSIIILAFCACIIMQMATTHNLLSLNFSTYISSVYNSLTAGGIFFGCIAYGISALITPIATYILFSLAIVLTAIFMLYPLFSSSRNRRPQKANGGFESKRDKFVKGDAIPHTVTPVADNSLFVSTIKPLDNINSEHGNLETLDSMPITSSGAKKSENIFEPYNKTQKKSDEPTSINETARQVLYGDKEKRIADLAARKYNSNSDCSGLVTIASEPSITVSTATQKPPKKDHTSKIPGLPGVSIPPSKDFSEQIIGGDIINGEEVSRVLAENVRPVVTEPFTPKVTPKPSPEIKIIDEQINIENESKIELPPITNGDYFAEEVESKPLQSEPSISNKAQTQNSVSGEFITPNAVKTELISPKNNSHETLFSTLYQEEVDSKKQANNFVSAQNQLSDDSPQTLPPIINAERDYLPRATENESEQENDTFQENDFDYNQDSDYGDNQESKSSSFNIDERIEDMSEKPRFEGKDFTGYYEQMQDTNSIDLTATYKDIKADSSSTEIRSMRQIKIDDYINVNQQSAPKKKRNIKYNPPPIDLLVDVAPSSPDDFNVACEESARLLEKTLSEHKLPATVTAITRGPTVTRYELEIPPGIPVKRIEQFYSDIEYSLATSGKIRMEIPIHGKRAVGIEIPNEKVDIVGLKDIISSKEFTSSSSPITVVLGKDIAGCNIVCNLDKMPHLLIAGATGSGKSACLNSIIVSILYKASPEDVRLILIDPKHVEFTIYKGLPHLLTEDIITDSQQAYNALKWARAEMERRYILFGKYIVKNLQEFNRLDAVKNGLEDKIPYIVLIIDEIAELMLSNNRKDLEDKIVSISQKARASGIHLILATQRPTVDVITGTIKTNLPSRIAFSVKSATDSRIILDESGAETLLGRGDMLYAPIGSDDPRRVQGAWVSNEEVAMIADYVRKNNPADFDAQFIQTITAEPENIQTPTEDDDEKEYDDIMPDVLKCVIETGSASTSMIQRRFAVGYARASRIIDQMELHKFIGPLEGSKPRAVYITREQYKEMFGVEI